MRDNETNYNGLTGKMFLIPSSDYILIAVCKQLLQRRPQRMIRGATFTPTLVENFVVCITYQWTVMRYTYCYSFSHMQFTEKQGSNCTE